MGEKLRNSDSLSWVPRKNAANNMLTIWMKKKGSLIFKLTYLETSRKGKQIILEKAPRYSEVWHQSILTRFYLIYIYSLPAEHVTLEGNANFVFVSTIRE